MIFIIDQFKNGIHSIGRRDVNAASKPGKGGRKSIYDAFYGQPKMSVKLSSSIRIYPIFSVQQHQQQQQQRLQFFVWFSIQYLKEKKKLKRKQHFNIDRVEITITRRIIDRGHNNNNNNNAFYFWSLCAHPKKTRLVPVN